MSFPQLLISYFSTMVFFIFCDLMWIGVIGKSFYDQYLGHLRAETVNWLAVVLFYFVFIAGIFYFVLLPGIKTGSLMEIAFRGGLFGLVTYATYDLVNMATLKDFSWVMVGGDILWGVLLCSVVSLFGAWVMRLLIA